jgi:hypothetical protein
MQQLSEGYVRIYKENETLKAKLEEANQNAVEFLLKELYAQQAKLALTAELLGEIMAELRLAPFGEHSTLHKDLVATYKE